MNLQYIKKYLPANRLLRYLVYAMSSIFWAGFLFFFLVWIGVFGKLPSDLDLQQVQNHLASEIYTSDGKLLGKYFFQNRTNVEFEEISPNVINALIATEDARFYEHAGIDYRSMIRVLFKTILMGRRSSGGGSTIHQQLAKNLFPRKRYGPLTIPVIKTKEMIIAKRLHRNYTKKELLTFYLNTVSFGETAYGIATAARRFFSTTADKLTTEEAATLIGMLKATTAYNPRRNPENSRKRRNVVLNQMVKYGYLEKTKAEKMMPEAIALRYTKETHNDGPAPHFREKLRAELKRWCQQNEKDNGKPYSLYTDGLKIYTTIDSRLQQYAEKAVADHMPELQKQFKKHWKQKRRDPWGKEKHILTEAKKQSERYKWLKSRGASEAAIKKSFNTKRKMTVFTWEGEKTVSMTPMDSIIHYLYFLNAGFVAMEAETGQVKAWVGSINHKYFKFDHALAHRQVGSTFKPIVYAAALEKGIEPCQYFPNEKVTYTQYKNWAPRNSDGNYEGAYSMQGGLANSVNTISVKVLLEAGIDTVIHYARQMGIRSFLPEVPSIALGTADIALYEMTRAYTTFANNGRYQPATYLLRIEDKNGKVLKDFTKDKKTPKDVFSPSTAKMIVRMMQRVVDGGTGGRLRFRYKLENRIAGKTGTTQNHADGWFMGFTPKLVAGTWVGGRNKYIRFASLRLGQGANTALPIWGKFMQQVNADKQVAHYGAGRFPYISQNDFDRMDCESYLAYYDPDYFNGYGDSTFRISQPHPYNPDIPLGKISSQVGVSETYTYIDGKKVLLNPPKPNSGSGYGISDLHTADGSPIHPMTTSNDNDLSEEVIEEQTDEGDVATETEVEETVDEELPVAKPESVESESESESEPEPESDDEEVPVAPPDENEGTDENGIDSDDGK